ncbi:MAG: ATP-binding cassette domain-containing protein [bacterium]|nr:ATP-binding cassette domain-containing protein [bacterium]
MSEALLELERLRKSFGGVVVTNGVDLRVARGEIVGLIGPKGAGKTTLANLISGIYRPDAGDVRLAGRSIVGMPPYRIAHLGLLRTFQVSKLFGSLSVRENLLLPCLARARAPGQEKPGPYHGKRGVEQLLESIKLSALADLPARALSGGQRALLQFASGLVVPDIRCYLLDEPFAGMNPAIKETMIELIERENLARGVTFLVISHEMEEVKRLCSRIVVLAEGAVLMEGTLYDVVANRNVVDGWDDGGDP